MKGIMPTSHDYREDEIKQHKGNGWYNALHIIGTQVVSVKLIKERRTRTGK